jgi:preprotein translocase subunit SecE
MTRDWACKEWLHTHRDEWVVLAYCVAFALVLATIDWIA